MTTDRTALEAARDALPPLLTDERIVEIQRTLARKPNGCSYRSLARAVEAEVRAALSSPPVLPSVLAVDEVQSLRATALDIFDGNETAQETRDVIEWFTSALLAVVAAPREAAPALDDARDVAYPYLIALDKSELEALADYHDHQQDQADYTGLECSGNRDRAAVIRAAMQQEPRS